MYRPDVTPFFDHATNTWTYLVSDPDTGEAVIIDAVLDYEPKGARVSHNGLEALYSVVERRQLKLRATQIKTDRRRTRRMEEAEAKEAERMSKKKTRNA